MKVIRRLAVHETPSGIVALGAGREMTLDEYSGGHTVGNRVPELVGYLKEVAAQ